MQDPPLLLGEKYSASVLREGGQRRGADHVAFVTKTTESHLSSAVFKKKNKNWNLIRLRKIKIKKEKERKCRGSGIELS